MSEKSMRTRVVQTLKPLHAIPVENSVCPGTPDVNYSGGWIELKNLDEWPKRESTVVKIEHFTSEQRLWIRERHKVEGSIYLVLQVGLAWLILPGLWAAIHLGVTAKREDIIEHSLLYTPGFRAKEFLDFFR